MKCSVYCLTEHSQIDYEKALNKLLSELESYDLTGLIKHEVQSSPVDVGGQAHVFKESLKDGREVAIKRFKIEEREGLKWAKVK